MTLSSTEFEYVALAGVTRQLVFLRVLSEFLRPGQRGGPAMVFEGNDGVVNLSGNSLCTSKTKNVDVRCHSVREK